MTDHVRKAPMETLSVVSHAPAVAILGMHRSGTSLVARLLRECGLDLGEEHELLPANIDNTEGFWENVRFVEVNDRLLAALGGSWDAPPEMPEGWERRPELAPIAADAVALITSFEDRGRWGWKDPRTSLTLPFWRALLPELRPVVCLRHPVEVARSLQSRGSTESEEAGLELWSAYNRALEAALSDGLFITHYETYFHDPEAELKRVLEHVDLPVSNEEIVSAAVRVNEFARHHGRNGDANRLPAEVAGRYESLSAAAGPVYARLTSGATLEGEDGEQDVPPAPLQPAEPRPAEFKYQSFDDSPGSTHRLVLSLVPEGARVLEVGCATGYMSRVLRDELGATVVGIELSPEAAEAARSHCERVVVGDVEQLDLAKELQDDRFDVVLFADVLEHLRDPAAVLRRVLPFFAHVGYVVASIPNVAHASVRLALLRGEFRYRPMGLLDDTHLRFFTRDTIEELFEASGYVVIDWLRRRVDLAESEIEVAEAPADLVETLADTDATTYQFVLRAAPSAAAPRLAATRALLDEARKELEELRRLRYVLEQKDVEREAAFHDLRLEAERVRAAHEVLGEKLLAERAAHAEVVAVIREEEAAREAQAAREGAYREEVARLEAKNAHLHAEIEALNDAIRALQQSRSIRYTAPLRALARPFRRQK